MVTNLVPFDLAGVATGCCASLLQCYGIDVWGTRRLVIGMDIECGYWTIIESDIYIYICILRINIDTPIEYECNITGGHS